jgi:hypothetical protein
MTPPASALVLLVLVWWGARGPAGPPAGDNASDKTAAYPFPIYHDRPESGGLFVESGGAIYRPDGPVPAARFSEPAAVAYDPVTRPWAAPLAHLLDPDQPAPGETAPLLEGRQDWLSQQLDPLTGQPVRQQTEGPFGSVTAKVVWRDPRDLRDAPALDGPWKADHSWQLPLAGPVFVFGQFGATPDPVTADELKLQGKTGVGCKLPVPFGIELQVRGGRSLVHNDPLGSDHGDRFDMFLEVQARCPLPGQLGLEYQGSAIPALTPLDHDRINQDLGLALPLGDGKLRLGAKHQWESTPTPRPWWDGMQLYVGFELSGGASKQ